jgi:hypothetical protein
MSVRRVRIGVTAAVAAGVLTATVVAFAGVAGAAGSGSNAAPVLVTNPTTAPVPVAGSVSVSNPPAAPSTVQLLDTSFGGGNATSATVPVAGFKTVRLYLGRVFGEGCPYDSSVLTVALTDTATNAVIDIFTIGQVNHTMKVYDTPGTSLKLSVSGGTACTEDVVMWGRVN